MNTKIQLPKTYGWLEQQSQTNLVRYLDLPVAHGSIELDRVKTIYGGSDAIEAAATNGVLDARGLGSLDRKTWFGLAHAPAVKAKDTKKVEDLSLQVATFAQAVEDVSNRAGTGANLAKVVEPLAREAQKLNQAIAKLDVGRADPDVVLGLTAALRNLSHQATRLLTELSERREVLTHKWFGADKAAKLADEARKVFRPLVHLANKLTDATDLGLVRSLLPPDATDAELQRIVNAFAFVQAQRPDITSERLADTLKKLMMTLSTFSGSRDAMSEAIALKFKHVFEDGDLASPSPYERLGRLIERVALAASNGTEATSDMFDLLVVPGEQLIGPRLVLAGPAPAALPRLAAATAGALPPPEDVPEA